MKVLKKMLEADKSQMDCKFKKFNKRQINLTNLILQTQLKLKKSVTLPMKPKPVSEQLELKFNLIQKSSNHKQHFEHFDENAIA